MFTPDQILAALSGACDNGLPVDLDGHWMELDGWRNGVGALRIFHENGDTDVRFELRVMELDDDPGDDDTAQVQP